MPWEHPQWEGVVAIAAVATYFFVAMSYHWLQTLPFFASFGFDTLTAQFSAVGQFFVFGGLALFSASQPSEDTSSRGRVATNAGYILAAVITAVEMLSFKGLQYVLLTPGLPGTSLVAYANFSALSFSMLMSILLLKRSFSWLTWTAAGLMWAGLVSCAPPLTGMTWSRMEPLFFLGFFPAMVLVGKEVLLKGLDFGKRYAGDDREYMPPWSLFSVAALSALTQVIVWKAGLMPGFNTVATPMAGQAQSELFMQRVGVHMLCSGGLQMALLWALQQTSTVAVQFANALAIPTGLAVMFLPHVQVRLLGALAASTLGVVFAFAGEVPGTPHSPYSRKSVIQRGPHRLDIPSVEKKIERTGDRMAKRVRELRMKQNLESPE